jgi:hypothetical protein
VDDEHECRRKKIHSRYRKDFLKSLDIAERRLRSRKIPRSCLQNQSESVWRKVYEARNDQGLITLTGFDCASFGSLCEIFAPVFNSYTLFIPSGTSCFEREKLKNKGRKRKICLEDCLGLVLAWTSTRGSLMALQLIFGMTFTNLTYCLRNGSSSRCSEKISGLMCGYPALKRLRNIKKWLGIGTHSLLMSGALWMD